MRYGVTPNFLSGASRLVSESWPAQTTTVSTCVRREKKPLKAPCSY